MLNQFLALLERFVVAHELIAANSTPKTGHGGVSADPVKDALDAPVAKEPKKDKPEEDDLAIGPCPGPGYELCDTGGNVPEWVKTDDEPEEKPKTRKPRTAKPKAEPEPDLDKLREEIEVMAKHIGSGDSDDCADELDDLLDEYDARSIKKLKDLQVQEFHKELKAIVAKYYDIEE